MAQAPRFSIDDFFESNFDRKASEMPDDFVTFPRENFLDLRNYWQFNHHDHHITTIITTIIGIVTTILATWQWRFSIHFLAGHGR